MKNNDEIEEKELIKNALDAIAEACCLLFETNSDTGHAAAFMCDNLIKYLQVIYREHDVLSAAADYTKYEEMIASRKRKHMEIIK